MCAALRVRLQYRYFGCCDVGDGEVQIAFKFRLGITDVIEERQVDELHRLCKLTTDSGSEVVCVI